MTGLDSTEKFTIFPYASSWKTIQKSKLLYNISVLAWFLYSKLGTKIVVGNVTNSIFIFKCSPDFFKTKSEITKKSLQMVIYVCLHSKNLESNSETLYQSYSY